MSKLSPFAITFMLTAACGAPVNDPSGTPAKTEEKSAEAADPGRADFMRECAQDKEQEPFCSCSFEVAKQTLTPEELGKQELALDRAELLRREIANACTDKLPESKVKEAFILGCTRPGPALQGFCECTWSAMRKVASATEITRLKQSDPRISESAKSCMATIPEQELDAALQKSFMQGCMKGPEAEKFCQCAWKTVRKEVAPVDMVLGGRDWAKPALPKVRAACAQLAPKGGAE